MAEHRSGHRAVRVRAPRPPGLRGQGHGRNRRGGRDAVGASFDPFGGRRDAGWSADEASTTSANVLALQDERFSRGFTDHEGLHRTGFVHMNGRVYDPRLGRFLQPDPVVAAPGTGQGHNRYAYVGNAPLSATDPSGFVPVGGYVGRTGGVADYGALYGSLMNDLWSAGGFET